MLNQDLKLSPNIFDTDVEKVPTRFGYGDGVVLAGEKNSEIVVLTADLAESTHSHLFEKRFPDRFAELGVAEQNMTGIAAGLALSGKIPFMASYSVFDAGLNWLQVRTSICYTNANVKIVGSHSGFSDGPDGATHQALEDIALMRVLPNMTVIVPCDYEEAKKATLAAANHVGPVYLRLTREATPHITTSHTPFEIGKAQVLMEGEHVTVICCGPLLRSALQVANRLDARGIRCDVINCSTIKPLDSETILKSVSKTRKVITIEEHQISGGLGGAVAELLTEKMPVPLRRMGAKDTFGESGSYDELLEKYGLGQKAIELAILEMNKIGGRFATGDLSTDVPGEFKLV
ncbi:MAG TPA: transketolase C-terminal domain-containing protein [Candidatus Saccharimonadales bacterium]|nr:transketolase C-terminal domain-containing protein [Candidatus Saccharimonadales bacterium]